jgi:hypothetical protein
LAGRKTEIVGFGISAAATGSTYGIATSPASDNLKRVIKWIKISRSYPSVCPSRCKKQNYASH